MCSNLIPDMYMYLKSNTMARLREFFYIFGMNTNYLKVFIIASENRTSADPCCNWHVKDEVVFVHIDLTNILCQVFW